MAKKKITKKARAPKAAPKKAAKKPAKKAPAKPKAARPPRPQRAGGGRIHFICSECYEEFTLSASQMSETLTCPECLHVGKRPQENFLVTVNGTRGRERRILALAALLVLLALVAGIGLVMLLSPHHGVLTSALGEDTALYVVGGALGLFFLVGLVLSIQYERNRWEVYF